MTPPRGVPLSDQLPRAIFGIGLSRTGSLSLARALTMLGFPAKHWPHDGETFEQLARADYSLSVLTTYRALVDTPIPAFYRELDRSFPGSKFILTLRDKSSWLDSCEELFTRYRSSHQEHLTVFETAVVYGCLYFNRERFSAVYDRHHEEVFRYFKARPNDLLTMNIIAGDGWETLAPFLKCEPPAEPFPFLHRREEMELADRHRALLDD